MVITIINIIIIIIITIIITTTIIIIIIITIVVDYWRRSTWKVLAAPRQRPMRQCHRGKGVLERNQGS